MQTYIAILRGINVSAQKLIKMEDLRKALEPLGLKNLTTYIQSGNIVFNADSTTAGKLEKLLKDRILDAFGFDVPVIVIEKEELREIIGNNPYPGQKHVDMSKLHVTFLAGIAPPELAGKIDASPYTPDEFTVHKRSVYLHIPASYGLTKLSNNFFEKKLKIAATTRNWKTVNELFNIAENTSRHIK